MEVCRKIDQFLHTCSDCEVSFQALLHHIDFTEVCNMLSECENLGSFSI